MHVSIVMEDFVWSDPAILKILQNEVVLISLYVDDKENCQKASNMYLKKLVKKL
jgi:thiol:disulfide interchange protein DsbD